MQQKIHFVLLTLAALVVSAGCSQQTLNSAQHDANHDAAVINQKASQAAQAAKPELHKLDLQTRVTAALAAAELPTTIHVRADMSGVYLRGTVKTALDKTRAGQIARNTLEPGIVVHNELRIGG